MTRETIKIKFGDFWHDFNPRDNIFTRVLNKFFEIEFSEEPDFYFSTHAYNSNQEYLNYKSHFIIFLGCEHIRADLTWFDYVLDSDFYENNPCYKRFLIWAAWNIFSRLQKRGFYIIENLACSVKMVNI